MYFKCLTLYSHHAAYKTPNKYKGSALSLPNRSLKSKPIKEAQNKEASPKVAGLT